MSVDEITIEQLIDEQIDEQDTLPVPRYLISSYGADFDIEGLIKRLDRGDIFIPDFQRNYVWKPKQASQFVESILLGLPVPGIILALDDDESAENKKKMYVVDGLQRLTTLRSFIMGEFPNGKKFKLQDVLKEFEDKTFETLSSGDKRIINDYIIHATIIRQEKPDKDKSGIYFVFRRLNTNGSPLTPQEIRSAIYQGQFDKLLEELKENSTWTKIFHSATRSLRKADEELLLRFFALYFNGVKYEKPMESFLNNFMNTNRNLEQYSAEMLTELFEVTIDVIYKAVGENAFRLPKKAAQFNNAIFDAVMIGLAKRLEESSIQDFETLKSQYAMLIEHPDFVSLVTGATTDDDNVKTRIRLATEAFATID